MQETACKVQEGCGSSCKLFGYRDIKKQSRSNVQETACKVQEGFGSSDIKQEGSGVSRKQKMQKN